MQANAWDAVWTNATLMTAEPGQGLIHSGAIAVRDQQIAWVGPMNAMPMQCYELTNKVYDVAGACITPGFIDCHTHLIYAGQRTHELMLRLQGKSYQEIAEAGGGIMTTVEATRRASIEELIEQSMPRAHALMKSGVTTLEIKSGYGLDLQTELKLLRAAKQLAEQLPMSIHATFLGAHTIAPEYKGRGDAYVDLICEEMLPAIVEEKLATAIDVFCETIAFNLVQTERIFRTARQYGLAIKCHAEQLSASGAASLAADYGALSVDHLEYAKETDISALANANTVAVLLPGAFYCLRESQLPPIDLLRKYQVPLALASDCNPGTSPVMSLLIILNLACTLYRLTPQEALHGVTLQAARALGISDRYGSLTVGKQADFAVWTVRDPLELVYYLGSQPLAYLVKNGCQIKLT